MTSREKLTAELDVLSIDVSQHILDHHHRLLNELGATTAQQLQTMTPGKPVLVAGVKASTQTPPIPSGKRIIFVTLEDGTGLLDLAFFDDTHATCAHTVFHPGLLLVAGTVEARGPRRTVVGRTVWDLDDAAAVRRDRGPQAALELIGRTGPAPTPAIPAHTEPHQDAGAGADAADDRRAATAEDRTPQSFVNGSAQ